jgi:hypothetical protein
MPLWFSEPAAAKKFAPDKATSDRAQTVPASSISADTAEASGEWRMVVAAVCQPLAAQPLKNVHSAARSSV